MTSRLVTSPAGGGTGVQHDVYPIMSRTAIPRALLNQNQ
jgi:hypothetical protein